jgi:hypothetical protein
MSYRDVIPIPLLDLLLVPRPIARLLVRLFLFGAKREFRFG